MDPSKYKDWFGKSVVNKAKVNAPVAKEAAAPLPKAQLEPQVKEHFFKEKGKEYGGKVAKIANDYIAPGAAIIPGEEEIVEGAGEVIGEVVGDGIDYFMGNNSPQKVTKEAKPKVAKIESDEELAKELADIMHNYREELRKISKNMHRKADEIMKEGETLRIAKTQEAATKIKQAYGKRGRSVPKAVTVQLGLPPPKDNIKQNAKGKASAKSQYGKVQSKRPTSREPKSH